jgi:hypothetical protein
VLGTAPSSEHRYLRLAPGSEGSDALKLTLALVLLVGLAGCPVIATVGAELLTMTVVGEDTAVLPAASVAFAVSV